MYERTTDLARARVVPLAGTLRAYCPTSGATCLMLVPTSGGPGLGNLRRLSGVRFGTYVPEILPPASDTPDS